MGADTSATHLIFFITAMVIATGVVGVIFSNVNAVTDSTASASRMLSEKMKTDITIINDPSNIPTSGSNVYIFFVKNTGRTNLAPEYVDVIIEGIFINESDMVKTVESGGIVWDQGDVLQIDVTFAGMGTGDKTIRVITENGIDDSLDFTV